MKKYKKQMYFAAVFAMILLMSSGCSLKESVYSESEQAEIEHILEEIEQYHIIESREAGMYGEEQNSAQEESNAVLEVGGSDRDSGDEIVIFGDISRDGTYTDKESVAYYIHTYHSLPSNYITKTQARKLGWTQNSEDLWAYAYGKSIGGSIFPDHENLLPNASERIWYECDIDYAGGERGSKRLLYSNDGLIYYTEDFENFEQLY